ncbi:hypothetical protein CASFOL_020336 [Castilleja foliolosa]|uniref:Uncharacterized protein n=1 Tax=Castilleja foliolosa TaxID=1961234 RepID=A0ABD3D1V2_9LAMI
MALAVINPWDNIIYLLDPLRKGVPSNKFKDMVHACPKQEINTSNSGYYVCRYMREIIDHECTVIPANYFKDSPPAMTYIP